MKKRQFTTPMIIRDGIPSKLHRIPFANQTFAEDWLQRLLYENPSLIPTNEIEPIFNGLVSVTRELTTASGSLDLLYITPDGYLALVETKLWRSPESRREVVGQIIDYAKDIARWTYEDLVAAVKKKLPTSTNVDPLLELVRDSVEEFDGAEFIDRVGRNLKRGRFLLLIIGDGIQEGVENIAEFLQQTPQLGFTLGLVEMALFQLEREQSGLVFVQPRVLARTQEIIRAIVEIRNGTQDFVRVTTPVDFESGEKAEGRRINLTESAFFENLGENEPRSVDFARWVIENAPEHLLNIDWKSAGPVFKYIEPESSVFFTIGSFSVEGNLDNTYRLARRFWELKLPKGACDQYQRDVASLIPNPPGAQQQIRGQKNQEKGITEILGPDKQPVKFILLAERKEEWFAAVDRLIPQLQKLMKGRERNETEVDLLE